MLDTHKDDGGDDLRKHEQFSSQTPSVQCLWLKYVWSCVFFVLFLKLLHQPSPQRTHSVRFYRLLGVYFNH